MCIRDRPLGNLVFNQSEYHVIVKHQSVFASGVSLARRVMQPPTACAVRESRKTPMSPGGKNYKNSRAEHLDIPANQRRCSNKTYIRWREAGPTPDTWRWLNRQFSTTRQTVQTQFQP